MSSPVARANAELSKRMYTDDWPFRCPKPSFPLPSMKVMLESGFLNDHAEYDIMMRTICFLIGLDSLAYAIGLFEAQQLLFALRRTGPEIDLARQFEAAFERSDPNYAIAKFFQVCLACNVTPDDVVQDIPAVMQDVKAIARQLRERDPPCPLKPVSYDTVVQEAEVKAVMNELFGTETMARWPPRHMARIWPSVVEAFVKCDTLNRMPEDGRRNLRIVTRLVAFSYCHQYVSGYGPLHETGIALNALAHKLRLMSRATRFWVTEECRRSFDVFIAQAEDSRRDRLERAQRVCMFCLRTGLAGRFWSADIAVAHDHILEGLKVAGV